MIGTVFIRLSMTRFDKGDVRHFSSSLHASIQSFIKPPIHPSRIHPSICPSFLLSCIPVMIVHPSHESPRAVLYLCRNSLHVWSSNLHVRVLSSGYCRRLCQRRGWMQYLTWTTWLQYLYKANDPCDDMYILNSGSVECKSAFEPHEKMSSSKSRGGGGEIEIEVGDCFGEEALFPVCAGPWAEHMIRHPMIADFKLHSYQPIPNRSSQPCTFESTYRSEPSRSTCYVYRSELSRTNLMMG